MANSHPGTTAQHSGPDTSATPARTPWTAALILVMGIGPFATDTYLAALPELQQSLRTSATVAQLTLTAFIVGMGAGQLVLGPISDSRGRRGMLLSGAVVFAMVTVVCAVSPSGPILVAARLVQGMVAGGGVAIGRAVVTDSYGGDRAAATFGVISSFTFLGPVVAPAAGGLILTHGTWRTVFAVLAGLGVLMTVAIAAGIPETLPVERRQAPGLGRLFRRMGGLLRDWGFTRHVALLGLASGGFFTYIGGSSFVLQTAFEVSPARYTVIFATNAASMACASLAFRVLVARLGAARLRTAGIVASAVGATGLLLLALTDPHARSPIAAVWLLLCLVTAGMGLIMPATTTLAQEAGRHAAGTASALQGGFTFLIGAIVTPLTGVAGYDSLLPMALAMTVFFVTALALASLTRSSRRPA
ncbi:Bcr/CflA family drug resistance efflux transporter [Actinoplanes cyaneus]|uniref:Bcr/CflA family drug resistance efflux transporter n=1 Tax=Actinoplanes cyaneus TaxID=52696 RepID=A0A919IUI2_9ACTN|nr:multidrug effflux MFS transporter [Actinoplanes cyaneus]MCW2144042.1 MFS transporter, DHA1 family, bicyclomycin/chloramphenicol resistance protein [Actinoplanes cyaneus]GID70742.1 Bcr/CflA family drug resistance efflux transporter [Actinoplanes cyaneus]